MEKSFEGLEGLPHQRLTASAERREPQRQQEAASRRPERPEQPHPQEQPARQQPEQAAWRRWRPEEWQRVRCWRLPASRRPSASAPQRVR
jgi:hypothetical protein